MTEIVLEYRRVNVDKSTGRIFVRDGVAEVPVGAFEGSDFNPMMLQYMRVLRDHPEAVAIIQRTDREGLAAYTLDPFTLNLFRSDPVAALQTMNPGVAVPKAIIPEIRAGYDTLAEAFGDNIYVAHAGGMVECPVCGVAVSRKYSDGLWCASPTCLVYDIPIPSSTVHPKWVEIQTEVLLRFEAPKYYLPRVWNPSRAWISRDTLKQMFHEYKKEKENVQR